MNYKIVSDSAVDITSLPGVGFALVPLHIIVGETDFADNENVDLQAMQQALTNHKGRSSTACPSPEDWIKAFGDAQAVFCITITSALSGSFASAQAAALLYEEKYPDRKVYLYDSRSTGPEMTLLAEKLRQLIMEGKRPEEIDGEARAYLGRTHLYFALASLENFAKNGRVSPLVAKGIGLLGIRIIGKASEEGELQILDKGRGDSKAIISLLRHMEDCGYNGGKVIIGHNDNPAAAKLLKKAITQKFGAFPGRIQPTRGLCSYYAEPRSLLLAFEV